MTGSPIDKWEPTTQDKELIGKLQVACSISTDPANKLSLVSSLVTKVNAVMEAKCKFVSPPPFDNLIGELLVAMLQSERETIPYEKFKEVGEKLDVIFSEYRNGPTYKIPECMRDLYNVRNCSINWKAANKTYMIDEASWGSSNEQLHDILMVLDSIIRRNDLSSIPRNATFTTDNINMFGKQTGFEPTGGGKK